MQIKLLLFFLLLFIVSCNSSTQVNTIPSSTPATPTYDCYSPDTNCKNIIVEITPLQHTSGYYTRYNEQLLTDFKQMFKSDVVRLELLCVIGRRLLSDAKIQKVAPPDGKKYIEKEMNSLNSFSTDICMCGGGLSGFSINNVGVKIKYLPESD